MNTADLMLDRIKTRRPRIVVVGDTMVDRYVHGSLETTCQEGCAKFVQECAVEVPGGAGNAALSISSWGADVVLYGWAQNECPVKTRYLVDDKVVFRADYDATSEAPSWIRSLAADMVEQSGDAVLLSDYDKGMLSAEFVARIVRICRDRGIPVVADAKRDPEFYRGCVIKANLDYQHRYNDTLSTLVYDAEKPERLVVTAGPLNPIAWEEGPTGLGYNLPTVGCVNHVGAGDCFAAHLTLALACGFTLKEAAALAHSAGRVYVQYPHNRPPLVEEIKMDLVSTR